MPRLKTEDLARSKKSTSSKDHEIIPPPETSGCLPSFNFGIYRFFRSCCTAEAVRTQEAEIATNPTSVITAHGGGERINIAPTTSISAPTEDIEITAQGGGERTNMAAAAVPNAIIAQPEIQLTPPHPTIHHYAGMALNGLHQAVAAARMLCYLRCVTYIRVPQGLEIAETALGTGEATANHILAVIVNNFIVPMLDSIIHRYNGVFHRPVVQNPIEETQNHTITTLEEQDFLSITGAHATFFGGGSGEYNH